MVGRSVRGRLKPYRENIANPVPQISALALGPRLLLRLLPRPVRRVGGSRLGREAQGRLLRFAARRQLLAQAVQQQPGVKIGRNASSE